MGVFVRFFKELSIGLILLLITTMSFCVPEARGGVKTITLHSYNTIALRGTVDGESASRLLDQLARSTEDTVVIYIDSPGGAVGSGMNIIDAIKAKGKKIVCIANTAMSMAFSIFQSCDVRLVTPHAVLMQHQGVMRIDAADPGKVVSEIQHTLKIFEECDRIDAARLKMSLRSFQTKIRDDWYLFGNEIVAAGAADAIVQVRCSKELADKTEIISNTYVYASVKIVYSACPVVGDPLNVNVISKEGANPSDVRNELGDLMRKLKTRRSYDYPSNTPKTN